MSELTTLWNDARAYVYRAAASEIDANTTEILGLLPEGETAVENLIAAAEQKLPVYVRLLAAPEISAIEAKLQAEASADAATLLAKLSAYLREEADNLNPPAPVEPAPAPAPTSATAAAPAENTAHAAGYDAIKRA